MHRCRTLLALTPIPYRFAPLCFSRLDQFPEEKLLREALQAHGQWDPKVLAILTVPVVSYL